LLAYRYFKMKASNNLISWYAYAVGQFRLILNHSSQKAAYHRGLHFARRCAETPAKGDYMSDYQNWQGGRKHPYLRTVKNAWFADHDFALHEPTIRLAELHETS
jgi:hypothetical protein